MKIRVFIFVILSLLLTGTKWCSQCQGTNLRLGGQVELRNIITSSFKYEGNTQNHFISYLTNNQLSEVLPELKESIQYQSFRQRTKSWYHNSILIYTYIPLIIIDWVLCSFELLTARINNSLH